MYRKAKTLRKFEPPFDQGKRIQAVLDIVPAGDPEDFPRTPKRVFRHLDSDQKAQLVEAYRSGTPIHELAVRFEINRSTVLKHVGRQDLQRRYPAFAADQAAEVCRLYEEGQSSSEVAQLFGVSADTVLRALHRAEVVIRTR